MSTCPACNTSHERHLTGICGNCETAMLLMLGEILKHARLCARSITPQRGASQGGIVSASKPPINVTTLDYALQLGYTVMLGKLTLDRNGLGMLHEWERLVREERGLTPPALVPYAGTQALEIEHACRFHAAHLAWTAQRPWADEFLLEVTEIHRAGMIALRAIPARTRRITCPGDLPEGGMCEAPIPLPAPEDFADYVKQPGQHAPKQTLHCRHCGTTWTFERLLRVALVVHGTKRIAGAFGKDFVAQHLGITRRHVNRLIKQEQCA